MKRTAGVLLWLFFSPLLFAAQDSTTDFSQHSHFPKCIHPPPADWHWTKHKVSELLAEVAASLNTDITVRLLSSEEWADYINHHHFVPLTAEGFAPGSIFSCDWSTDYANNPNALPFAEVTESGAFYLWWEAFNYLGISDRQNAAKKLTQALSHQLNHYQQWQRIARTTLITLDLGQSGGFAQTATLAPLPRTLADIRAYEGAEEAFLRIWGDQAHYQCREVAAYSNGFTVEEVAAMPVDRCQRLGAWLGSYLTGSQYSPGCLNSIWDLEFSAYTAKAQQLIDAAKLCVEKAPKPPDTSGTQDKK